VSELKRKKGESFEAFMRRFQNRMRMSGKLIQAKKIRFRDKEQSRGQRRKSALERHKRRVTLAYLMKVGKLKELPTSHHGRR
jgi:ribosomal protein S21